MTGALRSRVLILGSGPAGLTAAVYAARAGLAPRLVHGLQPGGQMTVTTDVENYPGFADTVQGPWLMERMTEQAARVGADLVSDVIASVDLSAPPFAAVGDGGARYLGDSLIVATGARARWLGLESEAALRGAGVSACATCDGFFYRGRPVAVVGGGNTAVEEALFLANVASSVTLVHRRDTLRAEKILQDRLFANDKVSVLWDHVVEEIAGSGAPPAVDGARLRHVRTGRERRIAVDGVFVAIGHDPATELFAGQLDIDDDGYIVADPGGAATSRPGVFAAGDVRDKVYRQAVTAAATGCIAALDAERWLASA